MKPQEEVVPGEIVFRFVRFVMNPYHTRLDPRLYGHDWSSAREYYLQDRNRIRRDTRAFHKAWDAVKWRNKADLARALVKAGASAYAGRLSWDEARGQWDYCAGQFMATEIRRAGVRVVEAATQILNEDATGQ